MTDQSPAALLEALGHEQAPIEWRVTSDPPVPVEKFGKDHYSTLAYIEVRAVDHKGMIEHDHMRTDGHRHPVLLLSKHRAVAFGTDQADAHGKYPTRLRGGETLADHDDYDCLDDMVAAGWLTVEMPSVDESMADPSGYPRGIFVDPWGQPVTAGAVKRGRSGDMIDPGFVTGQDELWLCARAKWGLTDKGREVCAALRAHKADGGTFATFEAPA